jgi:hypothetical protein
MSEIRTPPSLKWLLDKRARLMGELHKLENAYQMDVQATNSKLERAQYRVNLLKKYLDRQKAINLVRIKDLNVSLKAIDTTLSMHAIQIDPQLISPIHSHTFPRLIAHGMMTRLIYQYLSSVKCHSASSLELASYVAVQCNLDFTDDEFIAFKINVRHRLKTLTHEGKLVRLPTPQNTYGRWALPKDPNAPRSKWLSTESPQAD